VTVPTTQSDWPVFSRLSGWLCCVEYHCGLCVGWGTVELSFQPPGAVSHPSLPRTVPALPAAGSQHRLCL